MRHDPDGPIVVLSPHLDDAVLSVFTVLAGPGDVLVVNVCDGLPPSGTATDWVRLCGGTDGAEQMRGRRAEDRAALATVGQRAIGLGFLDADERPPDATGAKIVERTEDALCAAARLLAPVGMGSHPDHMATRDAGFMLASAEEAPGLELYADIPYAIRTGWPEWVSGADSDPHLDPAVPWERALNRLAVGRERLVPAVTCLSAEQQILKAEALECYVSQIAALAGGPHRRLGDDALGFEVRWTLTPTE